MMLEGQWGEQTVDLAEKAEDRRTTATVRRSGYPLAMAGEREVLMIVGMHGGRQFRRQLMDMGLRPGARIEVLRAAGRGPLLIMAGETRLGIGRGMAEMIEVLPVAPGRSD